MPSQAVSQPCRPVVRRALKASAALPAHGGDGEIIVLLLTALLLLRAQRCNDDTFDVMARPVPRCDLALRTRF